MRMHCTPSPNLQRFNLYTLIAKYRTCLQLCQSNTLKTPLPGRPETFIDVVSTAIPPKHRLGVARSWIQVKYCVINVACMNDHPSGIACWGPRERSKRYILDIVRILWTREIIRHRLDRVRVQLVEWDCVMFHFRILISRWGMGRGVIVTMIAVAIQHEYHWVWFPYKSLTCMYHNRFV